MSVLLIILSNYIIAIFYLTPIVSEPEILHWAINNNRSGNLRNAILVKTFSYSFSIPKSGELNI